MANYIMFNVIKYKFLIKSVLVVVASVFIATSCIDEYWPDLGGKYDKVLVVDAMISDNPGPYTVKLSQSSTVDNPIFIPFTGCVVTISDNSGNEEILAETEFGTYQTSPGGMQGVPGRSYKIEIRTMQGEVYESDFEKLNISTAIDSVYGKIEYKQGPNSEYVEAGMQFYVDTYKAEQDTNYYLWRLENTFKFNANHYIRYIFDGQFHQFTPIDSLYTCWSTSSVRQIFTYSTVNLSNPEIKGFPLNFVNTNTKLLSIRYSLLVKQLTINRNAFNFWKGLEEVNTESGAMFAQQPYQLRGNIKNINNENEPVLGYFIVAGISEKRIFVDRPKDLDFYYQDECNLITDELRVILMTMQNRWPIKLAGAITEFGTGPALTADEACIDCTKEYNGASIDEPAFWEE